MAASKFFRVAVEGGTTDGRKIERNWLTEAAANYNPKKYGSRVNMEHYRSIYPDSAFKMYGDVLALKAEEVDLGDGQKRMALYAQIEPLPGLIQLAKDKQKIYTSIELDPKFADTGSAYMVGLAVTDSPASLGTEVLSFAAQNPSANPFAGRKLNSATLFTEAVAITAADLEEATQQATQGNGGNGEASGLTAMFNSLANLFRAQTTTTASGAGGQNASESAVVELGKTVQGALERADQQFKPQAQELEALKKQYADLKAVVDKIDTTEPSGYNHRPLATGGKDEPTDC